MNTPTRRQRTDRLRAVSLAQILRALGARPDAHDKAKWHTSRGVISVTGTKFFNWNNTTGGGGAIDLLMHVNGLRFSDAVDWLAQRFPLPSPVVSIEPQHSSRRLVLPVPVLGALPAVIGYLGTQRRLPLEWLRPLVDSGNLYADHRNNAVFLLRNEQNAPVGAELRGIGHESWRGMAPGSHKDSGHFAVGPPCPNAIVLCESAIDAISCRTLYPDRLCISTSGARPNPVWLPPLLAHALPIYCGFDADPTGESMAQYMIVRQGRRTNAELRKKWKSTEQPLYQGDMRPSGWSRWGENNARFYRKMHFSRGHVRKNVCFRRYWPRPGPLHLELPGNASRISLDPYSGPYAALPHPIMIRAFQGAGRFLERALRS